LFVVLISGLFLLCSCQDKTPDEKYQGAMVLAISWQPAFCERASRKRECKTQRPGRYDTNHFSLHGLWPQPGRNIYCGVSSTAVKTDKDRRWHELEPLNLNEGLRDKLRRVMPGVLSHLDRHEWIKHGTCYANSPGIYFSDSLELMDQINSSAVRTLFAANIGRRVDGRAIRDAFDRAFGKGAGERVRLSCKRDGRREIITEITLGLKGKITAEPNLNALIAASPQTRPGCPGGIIDPVGLQ